MLRYWMLALLVGCDDGIINQTGDKTPDDTAVVSDFASISLSTSEIAFGEVRYGQSTQQLVTITNTGGAELLVSKIDATSPFQANPLSLSVGAGSVAQINVSFSPITYEEFSAVVTLTTNDPDQPTVDIVVTGATITDEDGDGHAQIAAGGDDCDDTEITVYPGASEIWYDEVDQNCDGLSDFDQDGDGWESDAFTELAADGGGDCQDSDPEFYPGAPDEWYDNRDTNCDDADDYDADGDGSRSEDYGAGLDCDDNDPNANRSANERLNGKDDDCDDLIDTSTTVVDALYRYAGRGSYDRAGYSVAVGDLDDDGYAELVVGGPYYNASSPSGDGRGIVGIFAGGEELADSPGDLRDATQDIQGDGSNDGLGFFVTVLGDYDGDGVNDLAMSALNLNSDAGAVYVLSGEDVMRGRDVTDAIVTASGSSNQYLGRGIATDIDLDGDGLSDLVAAYSDSGTNAVALEYGGGSGSVSSSSMDARWSASGSDEQFYRAAPVGGDFDGDGYADLVFSDGSADVTATDAGAAWVVWGSSARYSGASSLSSVGTVVASGTSSSQGFAEATQLGPDWDGDGDQELWLYANETAMYVFEGNPSRATGLDASDAVMTWAWDSSSSDADVIRRGGDFTGDGIDDMFVFYADDSGMGKVKYFASEKMTGTYYEKLDYGGYLGGDTTNENGSVGYGLSPQAADLNGDGKLDMAVGDPERLDSSGGTKAGEAYVLLNEHL